MTLPQTLVVSPVGGLVTRFQSAYPDVRLDTQVTSLQVNPVEEGFDVALRIGDLKDSSLVCRKIRDVRVIAVATPGYLRRHGTPGSPAELTRHNCLLYSEFASRSRWQFGRGIVVGPDIMFEAHLARGKLRGLLHDFAPPPTGLYAVFPPGRFATPNRQAFVEFLVAALRSAA